MNPINLFGAALLLLTPASLGAQSEISLFSRSDSLQVEEFFSLSHKEYNRMGHHGPAVENSHMALRLYFNDSGAIDLYSKAGGSMELRKHLWYPSEGSGATGCDEYYVGKTLGLGGIALYSETDETVPLKMTEGRRARVGRTPKGAFAELISYGVVCDGKKHDISVRIDVSNTSRVATVTAQELNGEPVRFVTGVNYHPGAEVNVGKKYISVWGKHPSDVSANPQPIGAGLKFDPAVFTLMRDEGKMISLISSPTSCISTNIIGASTREKELNTPQAFLKFMKKPANLRRPGPAIKR